MAVQLYLFATRCTAQMALAKYLASDAPGNVERAILKHTEDALRANWGDGYRQFRAQYDGYWRDTARRTRMLGNEPSAQSWGWCNVTSWQDADLSTTAKAQSIPPRMREFLTGTNNEPVAYQWLMAADVELAQAWLARAMAVTPEQIGEMAPADQYTAIVDMWGAFANYWKAINVVPQAWARYRQAWEEVTRIGTELVLKSPAGTPYPRPCASRVWWLPSDTAADVGPWLREASTVIAATPAMSLMPPPSRTGYRIAFGSGYPMSPLGPGAWGQPEGAPASDWNKTICQEGVVVGAACYAPMRQSQFVWLSANCYLTGGMDPVWPGASDRLPLTLFLPPGETLRWWFTRCPPTADADPAAWPPRADVPFDWLTASCFPDLSAALYQPPPKRYVDLLWPLLEYLAARPAQEIAWEVMIDVMGKNAFSAIVSGTTPEQVQQNLAQNLADQRQAYVRQQAASQTVARFVEGVVSTLATSIVGAIPIAGPLAGAAVGSGLSVIFSGINAAMQPDVASNFSANALFDVFGRADSVGAGDQRFGMIERYLMVPASPQTLSDAQTRMYDHIRQRTQNAQSTTTWLAPSTFVMTGAIPAPVGFPVAAPTVRRRLGHHPQGGTRTPSNSTRLSDGSIRVRLTEPPAVSPVVTASAGVSATATVAAAALAGAAGGLALASRRRRAGRAR